MRVGSVVPVPMIMERPPKIDTDSTAQNEADMLRRFQAITYKVYDFSFIRFYGGDSRWYFLGVLLTGMLCFTFPYLFLNALCQIIDSRLGLVLRF